MFYRIFILLHIIIANNIVSYSAEPSDTLELSDEISEYYIQLTSDYLKENNYKECVKAAYEGSKYDCEDIELLVLAANVSCTELQDYESALRYSRKALIRYYESETIQKNTDLNRVGRLLYIYGMASCFQNDPFMAEQSLRILRSLCLPDMQILENDLKETYISLQATLSCNSEDFLPLITPIISTDTVKYKLLEDFDFLLIDPQTIDSIDKNNIDAHIAKVLSNLFPIRFEYEVKQILETLIDAILSKKISLFSHQGAELMLRKGQIDDMLTQDESAEEWYYIAKRICETVGDYGSLYTSILQNIALKQSDEFWGRLYIEEAFDAYCEYVEDPFNNPDDNTQSMLATFAHILSITGKEKYAEEIYRYLLQQDYIITKDICSYACNNYAMMLQNLGRYVEAEHYYRVCGESVYGSNMVTLQIAANNYDLAGTEHMNYVVSQISRIVADFSRLPESETEAYLLGFVHQFQTESNSFAYNINSDISRKAGFLSTIFAKTLPWIAHSTIEHNMERESQDIQTEMLQNKRELMETCRSDLAKIDSLYRNIQNLDYALRKSIPNLQQLVLNSIKTFDDIKLMLADDEAAIEFVTISDLLAPINSLKDNIFLAAYIILPEYDAPKLICLSRFSDLAGLITSMYGDDITNNQAYLPGNLLLYNAIWKDIIPLLKEKKKIYYSTSGFTSFINQEIIRDPSGIMLSDIYEMVRVSSTANIEEMKNRPNFWPTSATLYGGISYDTEYGQMQQKGSQYTHFISNQNIDKDELLQRGGWKSLPGSLVEINVIAEIMHNHSVTVEIKSGAEANEESVKNLSHLSPDILHIATHGFMHSNKVSNTVPRLLKEHVSNTQSEVRMSYQGLLFSGANNIFLDLAPSAVYTDDGLLTAEEIMQLDLSETKLVVLSACNSGVGDVNIFGEILGLQRAFKMAGVETVMMSLWKVPDESTAMLMTRFYENLLNGDSPRESLKVAMQKVREVFPDPYYWGAFVILD